MSADGLALYSFVAFAIILLGGYLIWALIHTRHRKGD